MGCTSITSSFEMNSGDIQRQNYNNCVAVSILLELTACASQQLGLRKLKIIV